MQTQLCEVLPWDSEFFGFTIGRITPNRLQNVDLPAVQEWAKRNGIDCLYFLADADHPETIECAEDNGFRLTDIRVTLESRTPEGDDSDLPGVRPFEPQDLPRLCEIARSSHHDSRFYSDHHFPRRLCDALYETWIAKSCSGYAEAVLVAAVNGAAAGYISCHVSSSDSGRIGLIAVAGECQGRQIGPALVKAALAWFHRKGLSEVRVVTQGRNCRAQRLYQRCGFLTCSVQLWFHKWFSKRR